MTKDFKKTESSRSGEQYGISWVLGGVAAGLLVGAVVYALASNNHAAQQAASASQNTPASTTNASTSSTPIVANTSTLGDQAEKQVDARPGFSYHAVLPQLELDVPIPLRGETPPPPQKQPVVEPIRYTEVLLEQPPQQPQLQPQQTPSAPQQVQPRTQQRPASAITVQGRYMLQLGAYRDQGQAESMRRHAKNNGLNTRVERAQVQGKTWYRVRIGPTDNINIVNRWKQRLSSMGISPIVIPM